MPVTTTEVIRLRQMYARVEGDVLADLIRDREYTPDQAAAIREELRARNSGHLLLEIVEQIVFSANARPLHNYGDHQGVEIVISKDRLVWMNAVYKAAKGGN